MEPKIPKPFAPGAFQGPGNLRLDGRCPICGTLYDFHRMRVLKEEDGASLLYITCTKCQGSCLASMSLGPAGLSLVGMVTELSESEVLSFTDTERVTAEDILELRKILAEDKPVIGDHT